MGIIKGIKVEAIEAPKIAELQPFEKPIFEFRAENYFTLVGKDLQGDLAESGLRLKEMSITPDLKQNSGVKYLNLSLTETKSKKIISPQLAIAAIILTGAVGTLVLNPEIGRLVMDQIKAFASFLSLTLLPVLGMVSGDGKGSPTTEEAPHVTLESILEELEGKVLLAERMVTMLENKKAPKELVDGWRREAEEAKAAADMVRSQLKGKSSLLESIQRISKYSDFVEAENELETYRGDPKTISFVGETGREKRKGVEENYKDEIITRGLVKRGLSRIPIEVTSGAYSLETLPNSLNDPLGSEEINVWSYGADGPEEVRGYEFYAITQRGDSGTLYLKTKDRPTVELIHTQVVQEIERTSSVAAALDWLVNRSPWNPDLFEVPDLLREEWARLSQERNQWFSNRTDFETATANLQGYQGPLQTLFYFNGEKESRAHQILSRGEVIREGQSGIIDVSTQLTSNPSQFGQMKVYVLSARQGGKSIRLVIGTDNPELAENLHMQFVRKLKQGGSIQETLNWMVHSGPFPRTLFLSWLWDWGSEGF